VINLSSTSALGNRGQSNYSAAKAGMQASPRRSPSSWANRHYRQCGSARLYRDRHDGRDRRPIGVPFEEFQKSVAAQTPVARVGYPEDVAHTISFSPAKGPASSPARSSTSQEVYLLRPHCVPVAP